MTFRPTPLAMDNTYVVLTPEQWGRMCVRRYAGHITAPYVPAWSEVFGRHVIIQETLGM